MTGAVFQMFAHGIMTGLFFALIGFIYEQTHTRAIADITRPDASHAARCGVLRHRRCVRAWACRRPRASSPSCSSTSALVIQSPWLAAAAFVGVVVTAAYVLRMLSRILLGEPSPAVAPIHDAPPLRFAPMAILAGHRSCSSASSRPRSTR